MNVEPDYSLWQGDTLLGSLYLTGHNFPWVYCEFKGTSDFEPIRPLFEREAAALDSVDELDNWTEYEMALTQTHALNLGLENCQSSFRHTEFLLHIQGTEAWFRL